MRHLQNLSDGPNRSVKEYETYCANGYKFQTDTHTKNKATANSGVYVKGDTGIAESDFYGVIERMYEIAYTQLDYPKTIVLFKCKWFDPSILGTRVDPVTNAIEIKTTRRYPHYDPFAIAQNVRQVYYVPYPVTQHNKRGWWVVIKTKPRGRLDKGDEVEGAPYQMDDSEDSEQSNENDQANLSEDDFENEWE